MRVISRKTLRVFWEQHKDAEQPLRAWFSEAKSAQWRSPNEIKERYPSASVIGGGRVVFNIKGNTFRLVVAIKYELGIVYIRFIGTHAEYDKVNAALI